MTDDWRAEAECRGLDPSMFFPERGDAAGVAAALAVCAVCPVKAQCLAAAEAEGLHDGIYGGTTGRERKMSRWETARKCPHCEHRFIRAQEVGAHIRHYHPDKVRTCGTNSSYNHGCRCDMCKAAHARARRARGWSAA